MNDRYDEFKEQERTSRRALEMLAAGVGVAAGGVALLTVARMALNPISPVNFLRTRVALGAAATAAGAAVVVKKLRHCDKGNAPCP